MMQTIEGRFNAAAERMTADTEATRAELLALAQDVAAAHASATAARDLAVESGVADVEALVWLANCARTLAYALSDVLSQEDAARLSWRTLDAGAFWTSRAAAMAERAVERQERASTACARRIA